MFENKLPFALNEGEKVITSIKPIWRGYLLRNLWGSFIAAVVISLFLVFPGMGVLAGINPNHIFGLGFILFIVIFLVVMSFGAMMTKISYNKFKVWLTNQRIINLSGVIGFHTESMPLENVMDVVLSRSVIDRILGLSSVMAVPMGGMIMSGNRGSKLSTVGFIPALHPDDATRLQKYLFDLRDLRKKELKG